MDVRELVQSHYSETPDLAEAIVAALADAGVPVDPLTAEDLYPVDQLHAGFAQASAHILDLLGVTPGLRVLDVGCGVGGTSRMAAQRGAQVTGVDLTEALVAAAATLTERVGLGDRAAFLTASADDVDLPDASFDGAIMIHVGMNLPDKAAVFTEVRRLLVRGGRFIVFDQVRTSDDELRYPQPWAVNAQSSFVESREDYVAHLTAAGFQVVANSVPTPKFAGPPNPAADGPALSPAVLFGDVFLERIANNVAAHKAGVLAAFPIIAEAI